MIGAFEQIAHSCETGVAQNSVGIEGTNRTAFELLEHWNYRLNCVFEKEYHTGQNDTTNGRKHVLGEIDICRLAKRNERQNHIHSLPFKTVRCEDGC